MRRVQTGWTGGFVFSAAVLFSGVLFQGIAAGAAYESLWARPLSTTTAERVAVTPVVAESYAVDKPVSLTFEISAKMRFESAVAVLMVTDAAGSVLHQGDVVMDLEQGANQAVFSWDASPLAPGRYRAEFALAYTDDLPPVKSLLALRRVGSDDFTQKLGEYGARLAVLEPLCPPDAGNGGDQSRMRVRMNIAADALVRARELMAAEKWIDAGAQVDYLETAIPSMEADFTFQGARPEVFEAVNGAGGGLSLNGPSLASPGGPVFLVGGAVDGATTGERAGAIARMARHGMRFAVLHLADVPEIASAPFDAGVVGGALTPLLEAAEKNGVYLFVQVSQAALAAAISDKSPDVLAPGFPNLASPALAAALVEHVRVVGGVLAGHKHAAALSLADRPQFKYDNEEVRAGFVETVRSRYPDRQELNRAWRAHLAAFDEITIWGDHPEHSYQNRRAYQFEWQSFHRGLIAKQMELLGERLGGGGVPLGITFADNMFAENETRHGSDRGQLPAFLSFNALGSSVTSSAKPYAVDYPRTTAPYVMMASLVPDRPLLNLCADIKPGPETPPEMMYPLIRTVLLEAMLSGAAGLALAPDSALWSVPQAAEALAVTALDARRLAPVFEAFRTAPADVLVFFSDASKIMDNGVPHLLSAWYAYEGSSFCGYNVRFVSEGQIVNGALDAARVLVMPETPACTDAAFNKLSEYVEKGGAVARVGTPIPYNERGHSRTDVIRNTANTVLVRGMNMPTEYLHAMDAVIFQGVLPRIPRPVNGSGYPVEGIKSRFVECDGVNYLYLSNLRPDAVLCHLDGPLQSGRDLLEGRDVVFPRMLAPLEVMLVRMDAVEKTVELQ